MKVSNLKQVSSPPLLLGARLQTIVLPFIAFYFLLFIFFNWNIALLGFLGVHLLCVYLTQKDVFLIEVLQATLKFQTKKLNRRSKHYLA